MTGSGAAAVGAGPASAVVCNAFNRLLGVSFAVAKAVVGCPLRSCSLCKQITEMLHEAEKLENT